jgi:hypothetical protein
MRNLLSSVHARCVSTVQELEKVPMAIVGGFAVHHPQVTFDYADAGTGQVPREQDLAGLPGDAARVAGAARGP